MNIVVMTSDKYLPALRIFAYLFNRYWNGGHMVTVVGFKQPDYLLPANFRFISMGMMEEYPVNRWSNCLIDYIQRHHPPGEHMLLMLEDYWLVRHVNNQAVQMLWDYAKQFQYVLKIDLCADRLYAYNMQDYGKCGYLDLIKSDYRSQYHMSLMAGIWNTELMLKVLVPDETPWQIELEGTSRLAKMGDEMLVLGTRQWPVMHALGCRGGSEEMSLAELHESDQIWIRSWTQT